MSKLTTFNPVFQLPHSAMRDLFNSAYIFKVDMQERALAGCRRAEAKIFPLEEELDLAGGGPGGGGGGPALDQQALHLPRAVVGASQ